MILDGTASGKKLRMVMDVGTGDVLDDVMAADIIFGFVLPAGSLHLFCLYRTLWDVLCCGEGEESLV